MIVVDPAHEASSAADTSPAFATPALTPELDLLRKYSLPGPRYTSYPPATQFHPLDRTSATTLLEALAYESRDSSKRASLYFHLPFCESRCWFCGCATFITTRPSAAEAYLDALERELDLFTPWINRAQLVTRLHFGGGSPTFLAPATIRRLGDLIRSRHRFARDAEISVEIDPRNLTHAQAQAYADLGCRRASLGVQDTDPHVQLAIHRIQSVSQTRDAIHLLRDTGYTSIGIDLIYGLPHQTELTFARTLDEVIKLSPDRIAVFSYAHVSWIKSAQRILKRDKALPSPATKLRLLLVALGKLTDAGYVNIGMEYFAKPDDELVGALRTGTLQRNPQGYSTRASTVSHAFGLSSISQTETTYRQNTRTLETYYAALADHRLPLERGLILTVEDRRRRTIIMRLLCERRLDYPSLSAALGLDFEKTYAAELASLSGLAADGLLTRSATGYDVTALGALLLRVIAMRFDAHLTANANRFSHIT